MIIYQNIDVTAAAGAEAFVNVFTSEAKQKRKLLAITCNNVTALIDLLVYDERELIADIPADCQGLIEKWIEFDRPIEIGHQLKVGHRNGTGGGVTVAFLIESEVG